MDGASTKFEVNRFSPFCHTSQRTW